VRQSLGDDAELGTSATAAWARLKHGAFRVIVRDRRRPEFDGLDLCRMVHNRGGDSVSSLLISATKINRENRAAAIAAGVDDFLAKPVDADELGLRLPVAERSSGLSAQGKHREACVRFAVSAKNRDDRTLGQDVETSFAQRQGTTFRPGLCADGDARVMTPQLRALGIDPTRPEGWDGRLRAQRVAPSGPGSVADVSRVTRVRLVPRGGSEFAGRYDFAAFPPVGLHAGVRFAGIRAGADELSGGAAVDRDAAAEWLAAYGQQRPRDAGGRSGTRFHAGVADRDAGGCVAAVGDRVPGGGEPGGREGRRGAGAVCGAGGGDER
jgi:CheY-like chemotaxis protein